MSACFAIDGLHEREARLSARKSAVSIHPSKQPGDIHVVGPRLRLDPRLYVVCMVRDPRDIVVSKHRRTHSGRHFCGLESVLAGLQVLRGLREHPRFIVVRYEDLVTDPSGAQVALERRMRFLERTADFQEFHRAERGDAQSAAVAGRGIRPIDTASIGNWRRHLPRIADQREGVTDALRELGYEADASWELALEGVVPVAQPPLPAHAGGRLHWLRPTVREPLRRLWLLRFLFRERLSPTWEGLRGLCEYLVRSARV